MVVAGAFSRDVATGTEDGIVAVLDAARVREAVRRLGDRQREVLERRYGEDEQTTEAIAEALGLGAITVRRAHAEALDELRSQLP